MQLGGEQPATIGGFGTRGQQQFAGHPPLGKMLLGDGREPGASDVLHGRVTTLLENGSLERAAGTALTPERSHVMLCGNPAMIEEMTTGLGTRGLRKHRVRTPGHITIEKYW